GRAALDRRRPQLSPALDRIGPVAREHGTLPPGRCGRHVPRGRDRQSLGAEPLPRFRLRPGRPARRLLPARQWHARERLYHALRPYSDARARRSHRAVALSAPPRPAAPPLTTPTRIG